MEKTNPEDSSLYLYGAGGHAKVIIEIMENNKLQLSGVYDDKITNNVLLGYKVLGRLRAEDILQKRFLLAIGNNLHRKAITEKFALKYFTLLHPEAAISKRTTLGKGTVVMSGVVINADAIIGNHVIINTSAVVEHDTQIGDFVHVAPHATVCGGVIIGSGSFVGAGAIINPYLKIGKNVIIGSGAVILKDVPDDVTVVGNPGRVVN